MVRGHRRAATVSIAAALALLAPGSLAACGSGVADQINFAVDGTLGTYNTTTVNGAASAGPQAFARVQTGFSFHGPDGQSLADRDFGSVSVVGREPLVLDYQIADGAVYSDGKPVTCDDLVLTWAAQSGRFPGFDAASQAGYLDISGIECQPGAALEEAAAGGLECILDAEIHLCAPQARDLAASWMAARMRT